MPCFLSVFVFFRPLKKNWLLTGWLHKGAVHPKELFNPESMNRLTGQIEVCPESKKEHYQVFVQFLSKKRHTALSKVFPLGVWDCKAQRFGTAEDMEKYSMKSDTRKPGVEPFQFGSPLQQQGKSKPLALAIADLKSGKSLKQVSIDHSEVWVNHFRGLESLSQKLTSVDHKPEYELSQFLWEPITDWSFSHIIHGEPGIGKTEFAIAHFKVPLVVSHIDDLRQFDPTVNDGIVFDDMEFGHIPRSAQIHICDQTLPRSIHIRYACALIPAHTRKVFTTNNPGGVIFKDMGIDKAIDRRIRVTRLIKPGFRV